MKLSNSDLSILRSRPHTSSLYLSIFNPEIVMQCKINNPSIAKGAITIDYDTVTLGDFSAVDAGFTLLIGSTLGARDIGKIRIRSTSSSQFVVSENSNIQWADQLFLTVLRYVETWPIFPRIINDPANVENVIFYKDYDIAYTNQNSILGTFVNAGPHRAAFLDAGGVNLYYTASGTYNMLGDTLSYDWAFEGGNPTGSTLETPGYVNYTGSGYFTTRLTVSSSGGGVDTTYRFVSIYPPNGTPPNWKLTKLDGSRGEGGYTATIQLYNPTGDIYEGALVVIFADDWYGSNHVSLGGNAENSSKIFFVGYVLKDSINYDYSHSYVEFDVGSLTEVMKQSLGFAIDVASNGSPSVWYQLLNMDNRRAIYHYLKWHTTVLSIADLQFLGQDYPIQYFDSDRSSMFDAIDNLMRGTLVGQMVSDRQGKLWTEINAEATPNVTGTFPQDIQLNNGLNNGGPSDWMNQPKLVENVYDQVSFIELGGIIYNYGSSTGTFAPIMSNAPGSAPSFRGTVTTIEGLAASDQNQLNALSGNLFSSRNAKYPELDLDIAGNYRNLDIAPQGLIEALLQPIDTVRGVALDQQYVVDSMQWQWDAESQYLYPKIVLKTVKNGPAGDTIDVPVNPADTGGLGGFKQPKLTIPPVPLLTFPSITGTSNVAPYFIGKWTSNGYNPGPNAGGDVPLGAPDFLYSSATGTLIQGLYLILADVVVNTNDGEAGASVQMYVDSNLVHEFRINAPVGPLGISWTDTTFFGTQIFVGTMSALGPTIHVFNGTPGDGGANLFKGKFYVVLLHAL